MKAEGMQLRCPECGSDKIMEWQRTVTRSRVEGVVLRHGEQVQVAEYGDGDTFPGDEPEVGYTCADYCQEHWLPLDCFVTGLLEWRKVGDEYFSIHEWGDGPAFVIYKDGKWTLRQVEGNWWQFRTLADAKQEANRRWLHSKQWEQVPA